MIQPSRRSAGSGLSAGLGAGTCGISVPLQAPGMGTGSKASSLPRGAGGRFTVHHAGLWAASPVASAPFQGSQAGWDSERWMFSNPKAPQCLSPRTV